MSSIRKKHIKKLIKIIPKSILKFLPDRLFIKLFYYYSYGKFPDLKNPRTFDEKLQWYKLNYRKPEMTMLADKFEVRSYVEEMGLENILNKLYFVKSRLSVDDLKDLPESYVVKATHGCGMNVVNVNAIHMIMTNWLKRSTDGLNSTTTTTEESGLIKILNRG